MKTQVMRCQHAVHVPGMRPHGLLPEKDCRTAASSLSLGTPWHYNSPMKQVTSMHDKPKIDVMQAWQEQHHV